MSFEGWLIFASFWVLFVTTPGPNAVNCIQNGMGLPFGRAMIGVAAILTQASLFLMMSAAGITALIAASPTGFMIAKYVGAAFLIVLGVRAWVTAKKPVTTVPNSGSVFLSAFLIATINPKSVAGYLAAFSQFIQPDVPVWEQMWLLIPTALTITALSYTGFTTLGALLGRTALAAVANVWMRRTLAVAFVIYGIALASSSPVRTA